METLNRSGLIALHIYNVYANNLVLETAAGMSEDELSRASSPSHGSVINLLRHIFGCEYYFLILCMGTKPEEASTELPTLSTLREYFAALAERRAGYLNAVDEYELAAAITVQIGKGDFTLPRWQLMAQSLIHSIHHRGELSIVMTELGYPLPTLDPILKYVNESGQVWPQY